jgi:hypothetical protein
LLDKLTSLRELFDQLPAHAGELEIAVRSPNAKPGRRYLLGQALVEDRLVQRTVPFNVPELTGLPSRLNRVISRIEGVTVNVKMRIGDAVNRPRLPMHKGPIEHVARCPVLVTVAPLPSSSFPRNLVSMLVSIRCMVSLTAS